MELKAMTVLNIQQMGCYDNALVYFKSEADRVIAELKAQKAQADNTDVGNRTHVIRLQAMPDKLKMYTECHLCGFRKWCSPDKNQQPICLACKTFGVNPRFTKDKCR